MAKIEITDPEYTLEIQYNDGLIETGSGMLGAFLRRLQETKARFAISQLVLTSLGGGEYRLDLRGAGGRIFDTTYRLDMQDYLIVETNQLENLRASEIELAQALRAAVFDLVRKHEVYALEYVTV